MIKEDLNNIDNPYPNETFTAAQAIEAVNRLLWSENVEDDDFEDAKVIKAFLVGTLPNTPVPVKHSKTIPVMETTIEGAQKRIELLIDWAASVHNGKTGDMRRSDALEYIGVFLDSVEDEMAAFSTSYNSLHERYVQALAAIDEWKDNFEAVDMAAQRHLDEKIELQREITELRRENGEIRRGNLNNLHAAHDNQ